MCHWHYSILADFDFPLYSLNNIDIHINNDYERNVGSNIKYDNHNNHYHNDHNKNHSNIGNDNNNDQES